MNFAKWLNLQEMSYIRIPGEIEISGKLVSSIDMMFETYPEEYRPYLRLWTWHFSAKLPENGGYLNYAKGKSTISNKPFSHKMIQLPPQWWDYAKVFYDDGTIKEPSLS